MTRILCTLLTISVISGCDKVDVPATRQDSSIVAIEKPPIMDTIVDVQFTAGFVEEVFDTTYTLSKDTVKHYDTTLKKTCYTITRNIVKESEALRIDTIVITKLRDNEATYELIGAKKEIELLNRKVRSTNKDKSSMVFFIIILLIAGATTYVVTTKK